MLDLFIHPFSLPICLRVVRSHELAVNTELLVKSLNEPERKLWSSVADDASEEAVKSERFANVEVCNAVGIHLVRGKGEMRLLCVQVDVCGDGCVCFAVDSLAWWQSSDEVSANDLPRPFRYGDWKCSQFGIRNWLESLALFTASNVLVDEGAHKGPPVVLFDEFQSEVAA